MVQKDNVSTNYLVLTDTEQSKIVPSDGWAFADVATAQHAAYTPLLQELRLGRPRLDFQVAAQAVMATGLSHPTLLEVGCGSGYYAEVLKSLVDTGLHYEGADLSPAMIDLARRSQPDHTFHVADASALPFQDNRFDIVMNGVSLMHIPDWRQALAEARRVASRFVILHTVPVMEKQPTTILTKNAYGRPVIEVIINRNELRNSMVAIGLHEVKSWNSIDYDLSDIIGEKTSTFTIMAEVVN